MTRRQFRTTHGEPFGFLYPINADQDRPPVRTEAEDRELRSATAVAAFLD